MDLVSPRPFWPLKNGLLSVYPALKQDLSCDVVVLGAGITGAFIAQCLAEEGFDTVVLDKRDVCAGSTSANTALLQYELDISLVDLTKRMGRRGAEQVYRVCHDSITAIEHLVHRHNLGCVYRRRQSVYLASHRSEAPLLREEWSARRAAGIEVEYWDDTEVSSQFSFSRPAALVSQQAAELDSHRLAHALLALAARRGTRIFDRTQVEKYHTDRNGVRLQTDRGCKVVASHAVFATGYESQEFLSRHIVALRSTYALASEPLDEFPGWWERCLIWETLRPYLYLRTTDDNRAIVGGEDDDFHNPSRRDRRVNRSRRRRRSRTGSRRPEPAAPRHRALGAP